MTRRYSNHNPLRAPDRPAPRPAADISWQGNPPQMTSSSRWALRSANTSPSSGLSARKVVTSSHTGRLGKRAWRMLAWKSSISTAHTGVMPWRTSARSPPPPPAKRCTEYFGVFSTLSSFLESGGAVRRSTAMAGGSEPHRAPKVYQGISSGSVDGLVAPPATVFATASRMALTTAPQSATV